MASQLHLPSLTIKGFRGIRDLRLPALERITLLAGKNGVGKTTILEAIRVFASRGDFRKFSALLANREELVIGDDEDGEIRAFPDFASLFHNHDPGYENFVPSAIRIAAPPASLSLSLNLFETDVESKLQDPFSEDFALKGLRVSIGGYSRTIHAEAHRYRRDDRLLYFPRMRESRKPDVWPDPIRLESLGPGLLDNAEISRLWDEIALTPVEGFVTETLRLIIGDRLERIAVVGDRYGPYRSRRVVAKLACSSTPIPLKRLGDGAQRLLSIALALANCRNGILLIDEVENGIHYSAQPDLWRLIFSAAEKGNVQVIAATHSWDCIAGFAVAANETPENGILYRLESDGDSLHAVCYSEENLTVAARQRIEVR